MVTRRIDPELKENARKLRREQSPAEKIMWKLLRDRRLVGYKFRRQHLVGAYIVDFVCLELGLVIELDGESHLTRTEEDERRDQWLVRQGFKVVRFWNTQVFDETDAVLEQVWQECQVRLNARKAGEGQASRGPRIEATSPRGTAPHP